ncbi:MAG TPA: DUF58 domain-containing protein, partial [Agromyces sp.]
MSETEQAPPPSQTRIAVRSTRRALAASIRSLGGRVAAAGRGITGFARPVTSVISTTGWLVLGSAVAALAIAWGFGWVEFAFLGFTLLAALVVSVAFVFGRMHFAVGIELLPARVFA